MENFESEDFWGGRRQNMIELVFIFDIIHVFQYATIVYFIDWIKRNSS